MDVKTLCLGVLAMRPATGYEIRKGLEEGLFSHFQDAAFGSIYPALKALAAEGLVVGAEEAQEARPDRRVYRLTEAGRNALLAALLKPPGPDKVRSDFMFVMVFAHLLPPERLDALLQERARWLREHIALLDCGGDQPIEPGRVFARGYGLAVYRAELEYVESARRPFIDRVRAHAAAGEPAMVGAVAGRTDP